MASEALFEDRKGATRTLQAAFRPHETTELATADDGRDRAEGSISKPKRSSPLRISRQMRDVESGPPTTSTPPRRLRRSSMPICSARPPTPKQAEVAPSLSRPGRDETPPRSNRQASASHSCSRSVAVSGPSCSITLPDESRTSRPAPGTNVPSPRRRTMLFDPVENCAPVTRSMWKIRTPKVGSEYPLAALLNVPG